MLQLFEFSWTIVKLMTNTYFLEQSALRIHSSVSCPWWDFSVLLWPVTSSLDVRILEGVALQPVLGSCFLVRPLSNGTLCVKFKTGLESFRDTYACQIITLHTFNFHNTCCLVVHGYQPSHITTKRNVHWRSSKTRRGLCIEGKRKVFWGNAFLLVAQTRNTWNYPWLLSFSHTANPIY